MNEQSGRSLIEMLGVLAIGGIITFGAVKMYQSIRLRQQRFIMEQELSTLSENIRILYSGRSDYTNISKSYLIKAGALKTEQIGRRDFSVNANADGKSFAIVFDGLSLGDCTHFATKIMDWTVAVSVNGTTESPAAACVESSTNKLEFIVQ